MSSDKATAHPATSDSCVAQGGEAVNSPNPASRAKKGMRRVETGPVVESRKSAEAASANTRQIGRPKSERAGYTTRDKFRHLQEILGDNDGRILYVLPKVKFWVFECDAFVLDVPPMDAMPLYYEYEYRATTCKVCGLFTPAIWVTRREFTRGVLTEVYDFWLEYDLVVGCFNQSTVRDWTTLVNSIFMVVNRGLTCPIISPDVNSKLEAIAALYMWRLPQDFTAKSALLSVLGKYRPIPEGWYALGSLDSPDVGDPKVPYHFKTRLTPAREHYVARLLDDDLHGIVHPAYAPAETPEEYIKAIAKRLSRPERIPAVFVDGNGDTWELDRNTMRNFVRASAMQYMGHIVRHMSTIRPLTPEEVLEECRSHAQQRFSSQRERDAYNEGARIAMEEAVDSPLFRRVLHSTIKVTPVKKDEQYPEPKPLRFIMVPNIKARGFCHALLMNAQRRLFGDGNIRNPHCVKHMTEEERRDYVTNLFGTSPVANTDYSSLESSIGQDHIRDIEEFCFTSLATQSERLKVQTYFQFLASHNYEASSGLLRMELPPMRLSGQDHTSAGNFLCNIVWLITIIRLAGGCSPDLERFRVLCEGDDGLFTQRIPLMDGREYEMEPEKADIIAKAIGARLKINLFGSVNEASFCGINLAPCVVEGRPCEELCLDEKWVLSKVCWSVGYDRSTRKHDGALLFARCLSYLSRVKGNPRLYDALWYLAEKHKPSKRYSESSMFRTIWLRVFYKGDLEDVPDVEKNWELRQFAINHHLPVRQLVGIPELLRSEVENNCRMVEVYVPPANNLNPSFYATLVRSILPDPTPDRYSITDESNPNDRECVMHAMHHYLVETQQYRRDYDHFRNERSARVPNFAEGLREFEIPRVLIPGEHVLVRRIDGEFVRIERDADNTIRHSSVFEPPAQYIELLQRAGVFHTTYHARNREIRVDEAPVFGDTADDIIFMGVALLAIIILYCFLFMLSSSYRLLGIPIPIWGMIANRAVSRICHHFNWKFKPGWFLAPCALLWSMGLLRCLFVITLVFGVFWVVMRHYGVSVGGTLQLIFGGVVRMTAIGVRGAFRHLPRWFAVVALIGVIGMIGFATIFVGLG